MSEDIHESEEYQKFVESMIPHCRCDFDKPCDGVLAGGPCDLKMWQIADFWDCWKRGDEQTKNPD